MPKTFWHLSIMLLTVWLVLLGAGCAGVSRRLLTAASAPRPLRHRIQS
jgi:hypothetical protein